MKEIFGTLCLAGAIQALFLSVVLMVKKNNRQANRFFSIYLFFGALDALELYLGSRGIISAARPYQLSIIPYSLVFGPSIFLYAGLLTAGIKTFSKKYLLLFVPCATAFTVNIIFLFAFDAHELPPAVLYADLIINGGGLFFEALLYLLSFITLNKYITELKEYFSDIDALKLFFLRGILVVLVLSLVFLFIPYTRGHVRYEHEILDVIAIFAGMGLVFLLGFFAVMQPEIFNRVRLIKKSIPGDETTSPPRYEKLRFSPEKEEEYVNALRDFMIEAKAYLKEDLTLHDLADECSLSTHHLSMLLNIHFKQNFYNFINSYRVEDVKEKLGSPKYKDQNILTIAYSTGFNSKTTFNAMFKKFTGKTPKEYRASFSL